jgi:hypothetical protein
LGRKYIFEQSIGSAILSELQARQIAEQAILQLFCAYYEVARLTENEINPKKTLNISRDRVLRAKYGYEYGQNTQLDANKRNVSILQANQLIQNSQYDIHINRATDCPGWIFQHPMTRTAPITRNRHHSRIRSHLSFSFRLK